MSSETQNQDLKRTPLFAEHVKAGAKMVPFAGWEMPVLYAGLKEEHLNVRSKVGLFDVSHMGEIRFKGSQALTCLQWLTTNDVAKLEPGQAQYSLLPNDKGGLVDDIIVYCIQKNIEYFVCVNASNKDKDFQWMKSQSQKYTQEAQSLVISDESEQWAQIAVQGPKAVELLEKVLNIKVSAMAPFHFAQGIYQGSKIIMATTGYTGEAGGEVFVEKAAVVKLWQDLMDKGQTLGVMPIGLGARDTLRTEKAYSLYGHEINDEINPYSANLGWVIKPSAKDFMGKTLFLSQKEKGLPMTLVGFKMIDKGIPRPEYQLYSKEGEPMGKVASGTFSPSLNEGIGLGYVFTSLKAVGSEFLIDIRGKKLKVQVVKTPFV